MTTLTELFSALDKAVGTVREKKARLDEVQKGITDASTEYASAVEAARTLQQELTTQLAAVVPPLPAGAASRVRQA